MAAFYVTNVVLGYTASTGALCATDILAHEPSEPSVAVDIASREEARLYFVALALASDGYLESGGSPESTPESDDNPKGAR